MTEDILANIRKLHEEDERFFLSIRTEKASHVSSGDTRIQAPEWSLDAHDHRGVLLDEVERLTQERDEARAENQRLRAERDTLLLDAADFVRWFDRHYPDPSSKPGHPWCVINSRLNAHADTLRALDADLGLEAKP